MAKKKILVFPCGSEIGLEIFRSLRYSIHCEIFGASSVSSNHGKYLYKNYIEGIPFIADDSFIECFNRVVAQHEIDFIFPAHDSVVHTLANKRNELKCKVIGSPVGTANACRSKKETYRIFQSKLRVPDIFHEKDPGIHFPVFLKPDIGQGAKGVHIANSFEEMVFYRGKDPSLLVLEYLPGAEYTIDCFTDRHGGLKFAGARERLRIQNGISVHSRPVFDDSFRILAEIINETLHFRGAWFFQLKKSRTGELTLLEIAPRIAGTMGLYRNLGVNFALLSVFDAMDQDVAMLYNRHDLDMDRALTARFKVDISYDHVYIDLDDCLVYEGRVNTQAISFLYQCVNKGICLHLLTRHNKNVQTTLKKYRLDSLFDHIYHIEPGSSKSDYVRDQHAIFIDDSFRERRDVGIKLGIPVFATDAIECLLDERDA